MSYFLAYTSFWHDVLSACYKTPSFLFFWCPEPVHSESPSKKSCSENTPKSRGAWTESSETTSPAPPISPSLTCLSQAYFANNETLSHVMGEGSMNSCCHAELRVPSGLSTKPGTLEGRQDLAEGCTEKFIIIFVLFFIELCIFPLNFLM